MFQLVLIFLGCFYLATTQWRVQQRFLDRNTYFYDNFEPNYTNCPFQEGTQGFMIPSQFNRTANYINCANPNTSYITLNYVYPQVKNYLCTHLYYDQVGHNTILFEKGFLCFDLYFQGNWTNGKVTFSIGSLTEDYFYDSQENYALNSSFCDDLSYNIKKVNITIPNNIYGDFQFGISNTNESGSVSIRNIYQMSYDIICYPSCSSCTGPKKNECTQCYFGTPANNVCPPCPSDQYYVKYVGCRSKCDSIQPLCFDGFCNTCPYILQLGYVWVSYKIAVDPNSYRNFLLWSKIYDPNFMDDSVDVFNITYPMSLTLYGIFKYSSGIMRQINITSKMGFYLKVKIEILVFNGFPLDCGIQFKFNNTYVGSIYRNISGIQLHKFKEFQQTSLGPQISYSSSYLYQIDGIFDYPKQNILFSALGNFSDPSFGWAIKSVLFTTRNCTDGCSSCDQVSFKCKICGSSYLRYRDGTCLPFQLCNQIHQQVIQDYCKDFDDETPYSSLLIKEDLKHFEQDYYPEYTLVSQSGSNFLTGSDRYFSYWEGLRILGGQFIWAQARLKRIHQNFGPHHSISIGFYVLFGPAFPPEGQFIYQIDSQQFSTSTLGASTFQNGTKQQIIKKIMNHSQNDLILELECFGPNNEVTQAYCGFYNYYLAIHYCQPYCLECTDDKSCTQWNSTYSPTLIQFSQAECQSNQYFDEYILLCVNCEPSCSICKSKIVCLTCLNPTYTLTNLGCFCKQNQYEESNQCFNCPIECNQCLSFTYCTECLSINNRKLSNGQCLCTEGYYQNDQDLVCLLCDKFCGTCFGPTSNDCLTCNIEVLNIQLVNSSCICPNNSFYENQFNRCKICHSSCLTCFNDSIDGCLTCDSSQNRVLAGLNCKCKTGFLTLNNVCIQCPNDIDTSLIECYKYCNNGDRIWHMNPCAVCGSGFNLIDNECIPICGDLQVVGNEQCDDGNTIQNDKCYNCQFQCPINCQTCDINTTLPCPDICGDGFITGNEECEDGNLIQYDGCYNCKYQCQIACSKCIRGMCSECATLGWQIDLFSVPPLCKEVCGDGLVVGIEECDDANFNDFDGCHQCKLLCRIGCSLCDQTRTKCLSCEFRGFEPYLYYCRPIMNDGLLAFDPYGFYYEIADYQHGVMCDGNYYYHLPCNVIGGVNYHYPCQPLECTNCSQGKCLTCISGQYLSSNNICQPYCNDNIKALNEYCEDSFILPYRGCQNCQLKCQDSCSVCDTRGRGCIKCKSGYEVNDFLCYSKCGDFLMAYDLECDDQNLIPDDGCHFCQLNCQATCLICIKGVCQDCEEGYQLINSRCFAIINPFEQHQYLNEVECLQQEKQRIIKHTNYGWNDIQYQITLQNTSCKFCFLNCEICNEETCIGCLQGYYLNEQQQCQSKCGDRLLVQGEECEINEEYCLNCLFSHPQNCKQSLNNVCINCEVGYYLDEIKMACRSQCGDGIITQDEQCELQTKGCFGCKFSCSEDCIDCQDGLCLSCKNSFSVWDGSCHKVELLVKQDLKCKVWIQGLCFQCYEQYELNLSGECVSSCQDSCIICKLSLCYECKESYYLDQNSCFLIKEYPPYLYTDLSILEKTCINIQQFVFQRKNQNYQNSDEISNYFKFQFGQEFYFIDSEFFLNQNYLNPLFKNLFVEIVENEIFQVNTDSEYSDFNFNLQDQKCNTHCQICFDTKCIQCQRGYFVSDFSCVSICGDSLIVDNEQCDDGNTDQYDGCYECQYQCSNNCEFCQRGNCSKCLNHFELDSLYQCRQVEQFQIAFNQQYDCKVLQNDACLFFEHGTLESITGICIKNYHLENYCIGHCSLCMNQKCQQCEYGYYGTYCLEGDGTNLPKEKCNDFNQQESQICKQILECDSNCLYCIIKDCQLCNEGYFLFNNECITGKIPSIAFRSNIEPICGDGIVQIFEECDDGNTKSFDGCYQCKFSCDYNCYDCFQGICQVCKDGFLLNINHLCDPFCGDNLVMPYSIEQCDDGNSESLDGCYDCKYECPNFCIYCNQIQCLLCEEGFDIYKTYCLPKCGDGIIIQEFEECDDQNEEPYDGCYECKFQCRKNCVICNKGVCLDECPEGMVYVGDICMIKPCMINCHNCEKGVCLECNPGYFYDDQVNLCIKDTQLDSMKNESLVELDENYYICRFLECVYSPAPIMQLSFLNQTFSRQYIQIFFDQPVKLKDEEEELQFYFNFTNLQETDYIITLHPQIQTSSEQISTPQYIVEIQNLAQLNQKPIFQVFCQTEVINSNNQTLQNNFTSLKLNYPKILTNLEAKSSQFMQNTNKIFMYSAISVSLVSLFSGDSSFFLETLDVLQQQSFLKFINVDYPENLEIYFQASDMLCVSTYFNQINLDYYYNLMTRKSETYQVNGKFQLYNVDPDLITSLLPQVFQCSGFVLLLSLSRQIFRIFQLIMSYQQIYNYFQFQSGLIKTIFLKVTTTFRKYIINLIKIRRNLTFPHFKIFFQLNAWDLLFKALLQISSTSQKGVRGYIQLIISFLLIFVYGSYIIEFLRNKRKSEKMPDYNANIFLSLDLCRKFMFHFILIFFQEYPILQLLLLTTINLTQCFIVFRYEQSSNLDKMISILNEGTIGFFSFTCILYNDINRIYFSNEIITNTGFIQMGALLLNLVVVLFKQLLLKVQIICQRLFNKKKTQFIRHQILEF
ncbi:unnamed protein product [Paramecium octaurelia]|uniref:EGF-like domain-containing protein n=1 Tax=Paramecium octaurelia TaxID=43137 RepID=A0A8S1XFS5_PAROT|nr:unnamed protein product [Paramecium octaurelia]